MSPHGMALDTSEHGLGLASGIDGEISYMAVGRHKKFAKSLEGYVKQQVYLGRHPNGVSARKCLAHFFNIDALYVANFPLSP